MKTNLNQHSIYLDYNATTPTLAEGIKQATEFMNTTFANPSSSHLSGLEVKLEVENVRTLAAHALGALEQEIVFTSGATEAIQISIFSILQNYKQQCVSEKNTETNSKKKNKILCGSTEHKAVLEGLHYWIKVLDINAEIIEIPVLNNGLFDLNFLQQHVSETFFVATMAVNNETGVISPLKQIEQIIRSVSHKIYWFVDGVQALGKIPFFLNSLSVDYSCFSGHKIYAFKGIGFLYARTGNPIHPLIVGGGQEKALRSGTENVPGILSLGVALKELIFVCEGKPSVFKNTQALSLHKQKLKQTLSVVFENIVFNAPDEISVPTTINFSVPSFTTKELTEIFDASGIRISGGSACSSAKAKPSHVLEAMHIDSALLDSAVRMSFGLATTEHDIEQACTRIQKISAVLENNCLLRHFAHGFSEHVEHTQETNNNAAARKMNGVHLVFSPLGECTWFIVDESSSQCVVIDPTVFSLPRLTNVINCRKLKLAAVLDTHGHADHQSNREDFFVSLGLQDNALETQGWPLDLGVQKTDPKNQLQENKLILGNNFNLCRILTPGHTDDSVTYILQTQDLKPLCAFVGDTILTGGLGRTDFTNSLPESMYDTLFLYEKILRDETIILAAHDYQGIFYSNWVTEKKNNHLISKLMITPMPIDKKTFCSLKAEIDKEIVDKTCLGNSLQCGYVASDSSTNTCDIQFEIKNKKELEAFEIFDVRQSFEQDLFKTCCLPLSEQIIKSPLSHFTLELAKLLATNKKEKKILFLCNSGARSLVMAKTMRRMGFENCFNLKNGLLGILD